MSWPISTDYQEALESPRLCFADATLRSGTPTRDQLGMPRLVAGSFANVFQLQCNGQKYAVRCFIRYHADQERRYAEISRFLKQASLPCMVGFEFLKQGIRIRGEWYPILKMEWIDGRALNDFISDNLTNPVVLRKLARQFLELVSNLKQHSVAHGDLQHGNVLVANGQLRLVDYDGMYVPALAGMPSYELGQRNYQHPRRTEQHFGPFIDNFSAWVIYASLVALSIDSSLWYECGGGEEHLLFRREDFVDPISSDALRALEMVAEPAVQSLAASLRSFSSYTDVSRIPPLESSLLPPLPPIVATPVQAEVAPEGGQEWIWGHIKPKPVQVGGSCVQERITLVVVALVTLLMLFAIAPGILPVPVAVLMAAGLIGAWLGILGLQYKSFPEVRHQTELLAQMHTLQIRKGEAETLLKEQEDAKATRNQGHARIEAEMTRKRHDCAQRERKDNDVCEHDLQSELRKLETQRHGLNQSLVAELRHALESVQQQFLSGQLCRYDLMRASIKGVGMQLKLRLHQAGIRTAADIVDVEIRHVGLYDRAYIVVAGRGRTHVEGIGPEKASSLLNWRRGIESLFKSRMPQSLAAAQEAAIRSSYRDRLRTLDASENAARQSAQQKKARLQSQYQQEQENITRELRASQHAFAKEIAAIDKKVSELKKRVKDTRWSLAKVEHELSAYAALTFGAYIKRVVLFRKAA